jgi:hypothetical protein
MIKVYAKDRFIGGIRNQHCCNVEPYGGCCEHMGCWQEGGGWSDRTFIYCDYLGCRVHLEPAIPDRQQVKESDYYYLLPNDCPVRGNVGQLDIFKLLLNEI